MALTIDELNIQIAADSSKATRALTSLIRKLEQLKNTLNGGTFSNITISNSFNKTTNSINKATTATNKYDNATKKTSKSTKSFSDRLAQNISKWRTLFGAFSSAARTMGDWFNESNDYIETVNLFNVSMGDAAAEARKYAETVEKAMGIDSKDFMQYQGVFKNLTAGFGVAAEDANTMSQNLTQLSYDMASFFNKDVETAFDKLSSAMSGQVKGLREFGIDTTVASLQEYALAKGIEKKVRSMTQAEKSMLRYNYIMEKSTHIQGDMARTIITPANALRILNAQLTQMKRALGNIVSVVVARFIPYVQAMVEIIRDAAKAIATFFGFDASDFEAELPENAGLLGGIEEDEDALDGVSGKLKKIKKQLMGFDELNILSSPDTDSDSGSDTGVGGDLGLDPIEYDFLKGLKTDKLDEIKEKMKDILSIALPIGAAIAAWKIAKSFLDNIAILMKVLANPTYMLTMGLILTVTGFSIEFSGIKDAIENGLGGFNFGEIVGGALLGTGGAAALGSAIVTWIGKIGGTKIAFALAKLGTNLGVATTGALGAAIGAAFGAIVAGIPMFFVGIYDAVKKGISWLSGVLIPAGAAATGAGIGAIIGMLGGPIGAGIGALIGLAVGLVTDLVILIVQNWESITAWCSQACTAIGQFFVDLWNGIVSVWNVVAEWFNTWVIQPVVNFFVGLWTGISTAASDCWNAIVDFFAPAFEWFSQLFGSIGQTISDIFYNIGVIASGCWEIIKAVWGIVSEWFDTKIIRPVANFFSGLWSGIKNTAISAWEGIKSVFSTIGTWINTKIIQPVSKFFSDLWVGFKEGAKNAWLGVQSVFSSVTTFFKNIFSDAWRGIVKVFSVAGDIFVDIKDGIVSAFKWVVNGIIRGLNQVVSIPFQGINSALGWLREIKIVGLQPFADLRSINIPQIPLLASGGMVSQGQMFVAREAGPELVGSIGNKTAVANNDQIIAGIEAGVYRAMVAANSGSTGGNQTIRIINEIDGDVVGEKVIQYHNGRVLQTGVSPLLV